MGAGRFLCVALPLLFTIASIIALLVATLSGVAGDSLHIFQVDLSDLQLDANDITSFVGGNLRRHHVDAAVDIAQRDTNISAADIGLDNKYNIALWGYCTVDNDGHSDCDKPQFDWANKRLNDSFFEDFAEFSGQKFSLPSEVKDALKVFRTGIKWTEVAYIAANVALGVELLLGLFAICSRGASCATWLVASIAAVLVCVAAGATTAMAFLVIGAVKSVGQVYGVEGKVGTHALAAVWIAAAFAIAAAVTWIFTICCCKAEHRSSKGNKHRSMDGEKLLPSSYSPLDNEHNMSGGAANNYYNQKHEGQTYGYGNFDGGNNNNQHAYTAVQPQFAQFESEHRDQYYGSPQYPSGAARSDLAYEPYSHRA